MWLMEKIRNAVQESSSRGSSSRDKKPKGTVYRNVLTPDKIPDFCIPPKLPTAPPEPLGAEAMPMHDLGASSSAFTMTGHWPKRSPELPPKVGNPVQENRTSLEIASKHIVRIEQSNAGQTSQESRSDAPRKNADHTNVDPMAQKAMSLPYVPKAQTSYGFATLAESPHTRRKESLFHSEHSNLCRSRPTSPNPLQRSSSRWGKSAEEGARLNPPDICSSLMSSHRHIGGADSDTCSSTESSPFGSPLISRSMSLLKMFGQDSQSKVVKLKQSLSRSASRSKDSFTSPRAQRRPRRGAAAVASGVPQQLPLSSALLEERLHKEQVVSLSKGGSMRLAAEYSLAKACLHVRIIVAEDLYDKHYDMRSINCCVTLYLNPGKQQKQRSSFIRNSRNPIFNEDFFFEGLGASNLKKMTLKVKVINKGGNLKRDTLVGERELPLTSLLPFI
ncbi:C2 calcium-dependent domain-containing protein 4C [Varanus komodoensis]|uniref:C2 calcium-dependent domain-containing protein 4C n=1 Tax=Varanus komodoensis TaxID=61221 RepID=UPI001CF7E0DF|nr:C2 calcium-dependent domain-containing protein 4C [Varanus komodoensis]